MMYKRFKILEESTAVGHEGCWRRNWVDKSKTWTRSGCVLSHRDIGNPVKRHSQVTYPPRARGHSSRVVDTSMLNCLGSIYIGRPRPCEFPHAQINDWSCSRNVIRIKRSKLSVFARTICCKSICILTLLEACENIKLLSNLSLT